MPRISITIPDKNAQPYRFKLDRKKVTIGRSSNNDIIVDCPSVSGLHCTMERVEGGYILRDRKTTNGTKLEGEKMSIIDLQNDSEIHIGDVSFEYELNEEELDELDSEEFESRSKSLAEIAKKEEKKNNTSSRKAPSPAPPIAQPVLASTQQGNGFLYGAALLICGILAFYAGLDSRYRSLDSNSDREGDISLLQDITKGRPVPVEKDVEEETEE